MIFSWLVAYMVWLFECAAEILIWSPGFPPTAEATSWAYFAFIPPKKVEFFCVKVSPFRATLLSALQLLLLSLFDLDSVLCARIKPKIPFILSLSFFARVTQGPYLSSRLSNVLHTKLVCQLKYLRFAHTPLTKSIFTTALSQLCNCFRNRS